MAGVILDLLDKRILTELDKNSRISSAVLARKVGKSRETVKYRIYQLVKKGIIKKFTTSINPSMLGFYMYKCYFKLENIPDEREKFLQELKNDKNIHWLAVAHGAFDVVFIMLAKSPQGYYDQINSMLAKWKHLVISKVFASNVDFMQYNKRFFLKENNGQSVLCGGKVVEGKIDELDQKILAILANDARISFVQIAERTNSTIEKIHARMKKLEEKGIILTYRIEVDYHKLGMEYFKSIIYLRALSKSSEKSLFEWMLKHPNSLYYVRTIAPWDIELEFAVENYHEFNDIINKLRADYRNVIKNNEHLIIEEETWMPAHSEDNFYN